MKRNTPKEVLKYCPRCGSPNFLYKKTDSFECADCDFVFFVNAVSAVTCIIRNEAREILLTTRKNNPGAGLLDLPGGFVDIKEKAEDTVIREIKEELGLDITAARLVGTYPNEYLYSGIIVYTLDLCFECEVKNLEQAKAADDVLDFDFYNIKDIDLEKIALDSIRTILREYQLKDL